MRILRTYLARQALQENKSHRAPGCTRTRTGAQAAEVLRGLQARGDGGSARERCVGTRDGEVPDPSDSWEIVVASPPRAHLAPRTLGTTSARSSISIRLAMRKAGAERKRRRLYGLLSFRHAHARAACAHRHAPGRLATDAHVEEDCAQRSGVREEGERQKRCACNRRAPHRSDVPTGLGMVSE